MVDVRKGTVQSYTRGKDSAFSGLGKTHTKPFNVSKKRWDEIFGGKNDTSRKETDENGSIGEEQSSTSDATVRTD